MNCTYCEKPVADNYCSHCGQHVVKRFTGAMAMAWVRDELFILDRGFLYTIKELLIHPVQTINLYLNGHIRKYFNPFKLTVILSTTSVATVMFTADNDIVSLNEVITQGPPAFSTSSFEYILLNWPNLVVPNLVYHFFITTLLISLASRLSFRKRGLNFIEHLIFVYFVTCYFMLLNYCVIPLYALRLWITFNQFMMILIPTFLLMLTTVIVVAKRFYQESYLKTIFRGIFCLYGSIILSLFFQLIMISMAKAVYEAWH